MRKQLKHELRRQTCCTSSPICRKPCRMLSLHYSMVCSLLFRACVRCHVFRRCTKVVRGPFILHALASSTDLPKYARRKYGLFIICFRCLTVIHGPLGRGAAHQPTGVHLQQSACCQPAHASTRCRRGNQVDYGCISENVFVSRVQFGAHL